MLSKVVNNCPQVSSDMTVTPSTLIKYLKKTSLHITENLRNAMNVMYYH